MKSEIISIGSEITSGQIIDTNSSFLAKELLDLGIESHFHTSVDDNIERIQKALETALQRSDLVITTGGLGPTHDDLTHTAINSCLGMQMVLDRKYLKRIKQKFYLKGYKKMPQINKKQAYKPKTARWIPNKSGTANGMILKISSKIIMTFPGVPRELKRMWYDTTKSYLKNLTKNTIYSRILKFTGIGESALAEKLKNYFKLKNPLIAPYTSTGEVIIKITGKGKSLAEVKKLVNSFAYKIITKAKKYYFGKDNETLEGIVAKLLTSKKKTIAIAESCTGGLLSTRLTDIPGSSNYIHFNAVTYSNKFKVKLLNISENLIKKYGAVSKQVATYMASGIKKYTNSNIGFSITGVAGPAGGRKEKPVGLVYFGLAMGNKTKTKKAFFGSNTKRDEIRFSATQFALNWLRKELNSCHNSI